MGIHEIFSAKDINRPKNSKKHYYYSYIILGSRLGCSSFELKFKIGDVRNPQDDVIQNSK